MNFYNPEFIHPENHLNQDILPERHKNHPLQYLETSYMHPMHEQKS